MSLSLPLRPERLSAPATPFLASPVCHSNPSNEKGPSNGALLVRSCLGLRKRLRRGGIYCFGDEARTEFLTELARLTTSWAAFKSSRLNDAQWCQPKLTVRVKHLAGSKMLRHATVKGLAGTHV